MNNNNFIPLTNNDIIIYNNVQSKVYKYFINFHKNSGIKFDECIKNTSLNQNEIYKLSQDYCKDFKYNICLCNRISYKNNLIDYNYNKIYKCINNKRILYNINNFNFTNPINFINNNEKIFPIDIFTFYRQEYIPFIINEEFIKSKKKKSNITLFNNIRLSSVFIRFKENYYNHKNKKIKKQSNIKLADDFRLYSVFIRFKENYYNHKDKKIKKQSNIKLADDFRLSSVFIRFKENYYNHKNKTIKKQSNIKLADDFRLSSVFIRFKEFRFKDDKIILKYFFKSFYSFYIYNKLHSLYNDNTYYNELINLFDTKSFLLNDMNDNNSNCINLNSNDMNDIYFNLNSNIYNNNDIKQINDDIYFNLNSNIYNNNNNNDIKQINDDMNDIYFNSNSNIYDMNNIYFNSNSNFYNNNDIKQINDDINYNIKKINNNYYSILLSLI
jgi:hypothetical protein